MKKIYYPLACCLIGGMLASCGGGAKKSNATEEAAAPTTTAVSYSKSLKAPETDSLNLPIDADGYITIFEERAWTDGVDTVRIKCLPGGLLRMVASNSVEPVPVKDRPVKVVT